jgi:AcrR family transcriptional regulator
MTLSNPDKARLGLCRRRKETRPSELIRAAHDTFAERGFAATRLEDVAEKAGVAKGTIYLYFKNKEVLFRAVVEAGGATLLETIQAQATLAAITDRPAIELLRGYCAAWQRIMRETTMASLLKLLVAESGNFPEVAQWFNHSVLRPAKTVMADIVAAGIADGDFRPIPTEIAADTFFALMWQCAFNKVYCNPPSPERFLEESFEVLARGVVADPAKRCVQNVRSRNKP